MPSSGRGSFTSRSPLFGCNLDQYDQLVEEKLALSPALATSSRSGARVVAPLAGEILADAGAVAS
jgi:hypothetical protein